MCTRTILRTAVAAVVALSASGAAAQAGGQSACPPGTSGSPPYCEPTFGPEQFAATGGGEQFAACSSAVADSLALSGRAAAAGAVCEFGVTLKCDAPGSAGSCEGAISGSLTGKIPGASANGARSFRITIPKTKFSVPAGKRRRVRIRLSHGATRRLRRVEVARGKLRVTTTNSPGGPVRRSLKLRLRYRR